MSLWVLLDDLITRKFTELLRSKTPISLEQLKWHQPPQELHPTARSWQLERHRARNIKAERKSLVCQKQMSRVSSKRGKSSNFCHFITHFLASKHSIGSKQLFNDQLLFSCYGLRTALELKFPENLLLVAWSYWEETEPLTCQSKREIFSIDEELQLHHATNQQLSYSQVNTLQRVFVVPQQAKFALLLSWLSCFPPKFSSSHFAHSKLLNNY